MRIQGTILWTVLLILESGALCSAQDIIGYYPSWKWEVMPLSQIPFDKLTCINYAFFRPLPDGTIVGKDSVGDKMILGEHQEPSTGETLVPTAHRNGVKVMLSIGGWTDSENFPAVASRPETRSAFVHSCLEQVRLYGFDGIDLDWEYPGYPDHGGSPADGKNFTRLLRELKDSLEAYGETSATSYRLTAALPSFESALSNYEVDSLRVLLDALNVMTYDYYGSWSARSGHNAALYASPEQDSLSSMDAAFKLFTIHYSIPPGLVNLGVPFYGHTFAECTDLNSPHGGPDTIHFRGDGATYAALASLVDSCDRHWDEHARVPYLICARWKTVVSYDDPQSVAEKARYVLEHKARGIIIWEITGDYMPDGESPLLETVASILRKK